MENWASENVLILHVFEDSGCTDTSPWAIWTRGWGAEENRHGDLLNKYFYLTGRVDMKQIEKTIHYLVGRGMVRFVHATNSITYTYFCRFFPIK
ncbi:hypothetical protein Tsubulata_048342 [Turnera subulata]|uniref:Stearoyl-[acyl-carrier-protein] 9-desaturase n=1 Tax=Turnera subulata TaxID=218843 RepID=A0A9Q0FG72_9ROSI|nr:hypothetical protein Tsubulata_048342 [Turnera subulata]